MPEHQFDFIAIGDTVTDAFIRLEDASINKETNMLCMRFKDKIPYRDVTVVPAVGNSANAAVSAVRLGLTTAFITDLGADAWGNECKETFERETIDTRYVKQHSGQKTNYHYVLWFQDDRTILVKHEEYSYKLPDFGSPKWLYLSSMGGNSLSIHTDIADYLDAHPDTKLAFQPGTYQMKFGKEALARIYNRADFFVCNKEEYQRILESTEDDVQELLRMMHTLGPKLVVLTDGKQGAYTFDGKEFLHMGLYPDPKPPLDRTGAGDAFASTFGAFLALGLDAKEALRRAPINSMSVVQYIGAQEGLLMRDRLEEYLKDAPEGYEVQTL